MFRKEERSTHLQNDYKNNNKKIIIIIITIKNKQKKEKERGQLNKIHMRLDNLIYRFKSNKIENKFSPGNHREMMRKIN